MENRNLPIYTPGETYAAGTTVRKGLTIYISKVDIINAPFEFDLSKWEQANKDASDSLTPEQIQVLQKLTESLSIDSQGNLVIKEGKKLLGTAPDGTTHEIIGLNEYEISGTKYPQIEVGSESIHLNLNTNNDPTYGVDVTVDTPEGKKELTYQ